MRLSQLMNDRHRRSKKQEAGVLCICCLPGDGSGPLWLVLHSSTPHQETPTSLDPYQCAGKRVFCRVLRPVYRRGSSGVTSHQTRGPLKHIWVAPAVPRAIRMLTERRKPEQHEKKWVQPVQNSGFAKTMFFLSKGWNFVCLKRFALHKHSNER